MITLPRNERISFSCSSLRKLSRAFKSVIHPSEPTENKTELSMLSCSAKWFQPYTFTENPIQWKCLSADAPSRVVPSLSMFSAKDVMVWHHNVMGWRHVTLWRDVVTSRDAVTSCQAMTSSGVTPCRMTSWQNIQKVNPSETLEITFFNLVTLTFDLWPWNSSKILSRSMPPPNFGSLRQTIQSGER